MTDDAMPNMSGVEFRQQPYAYRLHEYAKITAAFVVTYDKMHPGTMPVPGLIDWFISHDTNMQAESAKTRRLVNGMVTKMVIPPNPVEIVGHSGLDGTERVIVDSERLARTGEDAADLARYLTTGNDAGAASYTADVGGWTFVRDTVTREAIALFKDGRSVRKS